MAGGRVLIVSPHFPPINAADHHRVRIALPHLEDSGWSAEILAVRPEDVEGVVDPDLAAALPRSTMVHHTKAWPVGWTRRVGVGNLALRAYVALRKRGDALLATGRFDLIFFSTTQFGVLPLGPYWKRRHGVPYVLDFQDEWVSAYYGQHADVVPPGGRIKYGASRWLARRQEPAVVRGAAGIISVSRHYNDRLRERYPELRAERLHEVPFGTAAEDFDHLKHDSTTQPFFDAADGRRHWVYAGRGGSDMRLAAGAFFAALRRALDAEVLDGSEVRVHLIGTSYAPKKSARESFAQLAQAYGLEGIVSEQVGRIPYFTALCCLSDAGAVLILGSDDADYAASKIYPALAARRPLLAIFHEDSPAVRVLREASAGVVITFRNDGDEKEVAARVFEDWILARAYDERSLPNEKKLERHSAAAMTRRLAGIFDAARGRTAGPG